MARVRSLSLVFLLLLVGGMTLGLGRARAATAASPHIGYDISFPDCGGPFPVNPAFGIVGVNGGLPFADNPCLGSGDGASELRWAGMYAQFYANTADPGPRGSTHWPEGQTSPQQCDTFSHPGRRTVRCAYDYGWDAATNSYEDAVAAYISVGWAPASAIRTPVADVWWLDVEAANSWISSQRMNVADLAGEVASLKAVGVAGIGFYAPASNWQTITGGTSTFSAYPSWMPGPGTVRQAQAACHGPDSTGGGVTFTQYPSGGFDGDYRCGRAWPVLTFTTPARTMRPGRVSGQMRLALSRASSSRTPVAVTSSSPTGSFARSPAGPWSPTLTLLVAAGATRTRSFYYRDSHAGRPLLRATTSSDYADAGQYETVGAPGQRLVIVSSSPLRSPWPASWLPPLLPAGPGG